MLPYHAGELEVQARTGEFDQAVQNAAIIRPILPPPLARFLPTLPWVLLGAADAEGAVWATALFGPSGFVHMPDEHTVRIAALPEAGDPLADLGLPAVPSSQSPVGLLAIDFGRRFRARINGRLQRDPTALCVTTEQVYANCMKYIQRRQLASDVPFPAVGAATTAAAREERGDELTHDDRVLLARVDTFFIATVAPGHDAGHGADVSHRGGHPGFVEPLNQRALRFADYPGNAMFNTLGNLELNPQAGLLVPDFDTGDLLHLTGRATVDYHPEPLEHHPGARRMVHYTVDAVVRRPAASPLRFDPAEPSPFLPPRPSRDQPPPEHENHPTSAGTP